MPLAAVLGGCTASQRSQSLEGHRLPTRGGDLSAEVWQAAREEPRRVHEMSSIRFWALPLSLYVRQFRLDENTERAQGSNLRWNDLSSPIFLTFLPLRVHYSEHYYTEESEEPAGRMSFWWNPLWTGSNVEPAPGQERVPEIRAVGVPLLFSYIRGSGEPAHEPVPGVPQELQQPGGTITAFTSLWTLGPAAFTMKQPGVNGRLQENRGYVAMPVLLGGALGALLWTDRMFRMEMLAADGAPQSADMYETLPGEDEVREAYMNTREQRRFVTGHGPVFGYLGYYHNKSVSVLRNGDLHPDDIGLDEPYGGRSERLVLGGILWRDFIRRDWDGEVVYSGHGPLWGFIGWGKRQERFSPRLFWVSW